MDDIGFTSKILDSLQSQYCIDLDRIFATGKSDGAGFDGVLACDENMSKRIGEHSFKLTQKHRLHLELRHKTSSAAFAPVSGAFYTPNAADNTCDPTTTPNNPAITPLLSCTPGRTNIPMLEFHGLADATIAYNGGVRREACLPTIPHWIQTWAQRAGLGAANSSSSVPGALEYSSAVRYEFGQGASQGLVTHIVDGTVSKWYLAETAAGRKMLLTRMMCRTLGMTGHQRCRTMIPIGTVIRRPLSTPLR